MAKKFTGLAYSLQLSSKCVKQIDINGYKIICSDDNGISVIRLPKKVNETFKILKAEEIVDGCLIDCNNLTIKIPVQSK